MTAAEFVAQLDEANQAVLRRLEPEATLKPEVTGTLTVTNLLKVALKNEIDHPVGVRTSRRGERRVRGRAAG